MKSGSPLSESLISPLFVAYSKVFPFSPFIIDHSKQFHLFLILDFFFDCRQKITKMLLKLLNFSKHCPTFPLMVISGSYISSPLSFSSFLPLFPLTPSFPTDFILE